MSRRRIMDDPIIISTQTNAPVMRVLWDKGSYKENTFSASEAADKDDAYFKALFKNNTEIEYFDEWINFTGLVNQEGNRENGCFQGAINLKHVKIPRSLGSLGISTFQGCTNLESIEIPDTVWAIGGNTYNTYSSGTFNGCSSLTSIYIPDSVTQCGRSSFANCTNLEYIRWSSNCPFDYQNRYYSYPGPFQNCTHLSTIDNFDNNITNLCYGAFNNCISLDVVDLLSASWNKLTNLCGECFNNCDFKNKDISIPNVVAIGTSTFRGITNAGKIEIGSNLTSIGTYIFACASSSTGIFIFRGTTPVTWQPGLFNYNAFPIYVPYSSDQSVLNAYKTAWSSVASRIFELDENGNIPE